MEKDQEFEESSRRRRGRRHERWGELNWSERHESQLTLAWVCKFTDRGGEGTRRRWRWKIEQSEMDKKRQVNCSMARGGKGRREAKKNKWASSIWHDHLEKLLQVMQMVHTCSRWAYFSCLSRMSGMSRSCLVSSLYWVSGTYLVGV